MGTCDGDGEKISFDSFLSCLSPETHCLIRKGSSEPATFLRVSEIPKIGDIILIARRDLPFSASFLANGTYEVIDRNKDASFSEEAKFPCFTIRPVQH